MKPPAKESPAPVGSMTVSSGNAGSEKKRSPTNSAAPYSPCLATITPGPLDITERDALVEAIGNVDLVFMNDAEVRMLTQEPNLVRAARKVMEMGPGVVVAKQGEYGAALFYGDRFFALPAYPLETVKDPTGAGDSFAGGFLGYLAGHNGSTSAQDPMVLRRAMTYGSVLASYNVEEFGTERVRRLTRDEIDERFSEFRRMTIFDEPS